MYGCFQIQISSQMLFFGTFPKGYKAVNSLHHVHILFTEVNQSADITQSPAIKTMVHRSLEPPS